MAELTASLIKAQVMRLTKVDACGVPVLGAGSQVVTKGFVKVAVNPEYLEGTEYLTRTANDELCVNDKSPSSLKRVKTTGDYCILDPDAIVLITGESQITTGAPATGSGVWFGEGQLTNHFSMELWQPAAGAAACLGGVQLYAYWAFPNLRNPKVGNFSLENAALAFSMDAETAGASASWGDGPGTGTTWLPAAVPAGKHFGFNLTTVAPPTPPTNPGAFALT